MNLESSETALVSREVSPAFMAPLYTQENILVLYVTCIIYASHIYYTDILTYMVCVSRQFFITNVAITMTVTAVIIHTMNTTATDPPIIAVV